MRALVRRSIRPDVVIEGGSSLIVPVDRDRLEAIRRECPGLDILADEELASLCMCFDDGTGEYVGVRFIGPGGRACTFGELDKAAALHVLSEKVRAELAGSEYYRMVRDWARMQR